ncbi:MAG: hypothetical protein R6V74_00705, partial [Lutibacter sp.]
GRRLHPARGRPRGPRRRLGRGRRLALWVAPSAIMIETSFHEILKQVQDDVFNILQRNLPAGRQENHMTVFFNLFTNYVQNLFY